MNATTTYALPPVTGHVETVSPAPIGMSGMSAASLLRLAPAAVPGTGVSFRDDATGLPPRAAPV